ncbi:NADH-quinone oxidoreductase subunit N [Methylocystis sp. IM3]|uniref:NADH-quinone oxidoreductase subunit N n=1 Tax=unclassified Methylocystis TaxID=2625913 RepID=UPI0030F5C217
MRGADFIAIMPFLVLGASLIAVLLAIAFRRRHGITATLTLLGLGLSLVSLWPAASVSPVQVTPLLLIDGYAIFYLGLILAASFVILLLSHGYLAVRHDSPEEYYLFEGLATVGAGALVASNHFASFFLGLEILTISLLGLIAYPRTEERPVEAGVKYLILAGLSSSFLLFGMALVYARLGTLEFARIGSFLNASQDAPFDLYWLTSLALIITGIGFKLSIVPFHMWAPDIYEGAPAPVAAIVAAISKGAVLALFLRLFLTTGARTSNSVVILINVLVIASIMVGNLLALQQNNVKRILAYSSVAHLGYLLIAFLVGGDLAIEAVSYYLVAYFVATVGAFGVITVLSTSDNEMEIELLEDYRGLIWRRPLIGGVFALTLLSLAGVPPTMGFFAKFYVLKAGVSAEMWPAVAALVVGSIIALFYYLRVIVALCATPGVWRHDAKTPFTSVVVLATLTLALVGLGVFPTSLIDMIQVVAQMSIK